MRPGLLIDHADCYRELRHIERERDDLRLENADLRAQLLKLQADLAGLEIAHEIERQDMLEYGW